MKMPSDNTTRYVFSFDETYGPEEFDTREAALATARFEEPEGTVWIGIIQPFDVYRMLEEAAYTAKEHFASDLYEAAGELVTLESLGDWPRLDPLDAPEICKALADAMLTFVPKPDFWSVRDVTEHELKDTE